MRRLAILIGGALVVAFGAADQAHAQLRAPIGQASRMRVAASEEIGRDKPLKDRRDEGQLVNTIHDMFEALRVCWLPPPPDKSRPGMEYTILFAFKEQRRTDGARARDLRHSRRAGRSAQRLSRGRGSGI
jgi:hypothetical protein